MIAAQVRLPTGGYEGLGQRALFFSSLLDSLTSRAEISSAAIASTVPFGVNWKSLAVAPDGQSLQMNSSPNAEYYIVSPNYFKTLGIRIIEGRTFTDRDTGEAPLVAIVDRRLAQTLWPGDTAIGKRIAVSISRLKPMTVIGVVDHIRTRDPGEVGLMQIYFSLYQFAGDTMFALVSPSGATTDLVRLLKEDATKSSASVKVFGISTLRSLYDSALSRPELAAKCLTSIALGCVLLGVFAVFGAVQRAVITRQRELFIQMALGCPQPRLLFSISRPTLSWVGAGLLTGALASWPAMKTIRSILSFVTDGDLVIPVIAIALLLAACSLACIVAAAPYMSARAFSASLRQRT